MELILQAGIGQRTEQQQDTLVRQLALLLDVLGSEVKVLKVLAHSDLGMNHTFVHMKLGVSSFVLYFCTHFYPIHILFFLQRAAVRTSFQVLPTSLSKCVLVANVLNEGVRELRGS